MILLLYILSSVFSITVFRILEVYDGFKETYRFLSDLKQADWNYLSWITKISETEVHRMSLKYGWDSVILLATQFLDGVAQ